MSSDEPGLPRINPERYRAWFPFIVLALGTGSLIMLYVSSWVRERFVPNGVEQVRAVEQIQTLVSISHLWVEEYVTGDIVDLDEISRNLNRSRVLLQDIQRRGEAAESRWVMDSDERSSVQMRLSRTKDELIRFTNISNQRLEGFLRSEDVGIGSRIDAEYDALFNELLGDLRSLQEMYKLSLDRTEARSQLFVRGIILVWALIVTLAVGGLWSRERRRAEAESALRESESRLLQAQKMEAVGRLAGGIAHDINNHLAAVTTQCEVVKLKAAPGEPIIQRMDAIIATAAKSTVLIKRLLAFSRRQPVQPAVVNLNKVISGVRKMVSSPIGEDIILQTRLETRPWNVLIDPAQLEQILLNLILNSRDAMPTGGEITISTENRTLDDESKLGGSLVAGDYAVVKVSDQGTGIPPELEDRVFEPFFTTKDQSNHSGLGLATVHGIVSQNRGHISWESSPSGGTTFEILLPRSHRAESVDKLQELDAPAVDGPARILLVEDHDALRESAQEILEALGHTVTSASNGEDGLDRFDEHGADIDLVITDVVMPGIGGKEMADRLREQRPELPVVFASGYTDDVILHHGIATGEVDFLEKPYTAASLSKAVNDVLAAKSVGPR